MTRRPRLTAVVVVVALVTALAGALAPLPAPPAGAAASTIPLTTFRDLLVDPTSGRVFVSGDDAVWVFDADGSLRTTIPDLWGAGGMDIGGDVLYVAETNAAAIAKIDLTSLEVTGTIALGLPVDGMSLAVIADGVWFRSGTTLRRLDLVAGTSAARGTARAFLERVGTSTTQLLTHDQGGPNEVLQLDISVNPAKTIRAFGAGQNLRQIAVNPTDNTFLVASGAPYYFTQASLTTGFGDGVQYPGEAYPTAVAYSPGRGGIMAGGAGKVYVARIGVPISAAVISFPRGAVERGVALSQSATTVYALGSVSGGKVLQAQDLTPTLDGVAPTPVAGVPTRVTLTGTNLLGTSKVTVGGVDADFKVASATSVSVTMPTGLAPGSRQVQATTPFGLASTVVVVAANTGATLSGVVRHGAAPAAGIQLTLTGTGLSSPRTTTTSATGAYSFGTLPYGADDVLSLHDPSGVALDRQLRGIAVVPNDPTTLDVDLDLPEPNPGGLLAKVPLGLTTVRDLALVSPSNRVFVSGDDEVDAFDADGRLLRRFTQLPAAHGLAVHGTDLYVNLRTTARIVRIDTVTLQVTGSWAPGVATRGDLAFVSGRLWIARQTSGSVVFDPGTGAIVDSGVGGYGNRFWEIEGSEDLVFLGELDVSPATGRLVNGSTVPAKVLASGYNLEGAGSASAGRFWTFDGTERTLLDLKPNGVKYDGSGVVDYSPGRGGVLALGTRIFRLGTTSPSHAPLDMGWGSQVDAGADRVYSIGTGTLVVSDLHPHLAGLAGATTYGDATSLVLPGGGLLTTSSVAIDGASVPITARAEGSVTVAPSGLAVGTHTVVATTPWGASETRTFRVVTRPGPAVVSSIAPSAVPTAGGAVTIHGDDLTGATVVKLAGVTVPFTVVDDETITATAPAHQVASGTVAVTTPIGTTSSAVTFGWVAPKPVVSSVDPAHGRANTSTAVTVAGSGFLYATKVSIGGSSVAYTVVDDTKLTLAAPPHAAGAVDVAVTTAGGTSATGAGSTFTYDVPVPVVAALTPAAGPYAGGLLVRIDGVDLGAATSVAFGSAAASFVVVDQHTIVAVAPPGTVGSVPVTVTNADGPSDGVARFTYHFVDVPPGAPFFDDVQWAASNGIASGYGDGTFRPTGPMNRQAMAALLYRSAGAPAGPHPTCGEAPFTDVPVSHPFCGEIAWMKSSGLATGNADGTYRPLAPVSRAAMAAFLYRSLGSPLGPDPSCAEAAFTDVPQGHPFCGEIAHLRSLGVVAGYADGGFHPTADVARAATAAFLHRVALLP